MGNAQLCWTQSLPPGQGINGLTGQHVAGPGGSGIILIRLSTVLLFLGAWTPHGLLDDSLDEVKRCFKCAISAYLILSQSTFSY